MFFSVDRVYSEKKIAVLIDDDNRISNISIDILPSGIEEGIILFFDGESYVIDYERTEKIKNDLQKRLNKLFKKQ